MHLCSLSKISIAIKTIYLMNSKHVEEQNFLVLYKYGYTLYCTVQL